MTPHLVPRTPGYILVRSRRYNEWQILAFEATVDHKEVPPEEPEGPLVDHPRYPTPNKILRRAKDESASNRTELDQADTKDQSQSKSSKISWVIGKAEHTNCTVQLSD